MLNKCNLPRTIKTKTFAIVTVILTASPVGSSTPEEFSCGLADKFLTGKSEAQNVLLEIFRQADESQKNAMPSFVSAMPTDFNESVVVEVGSISDLYADHVVVLHANSTGNMYIRIAYERMGNEYFGIQFHAADQLKTVLNQWPFFHEPKPLDC